MVLLASSSLSSTLPRARLRPLQQPPLDDITIYNTATHCYLLATDSLQRDYHLMTCRKHSLEEAAVNAGHTSSSSNNNVASELDADDRGGPSTSGTPSRSLQVPLCSLENLHDYTTYAVYSPTEAASLVEALQREHGAAMYVLSAVALIGAVRFTEGYYLVLVTQRRVAGYLGVHRLFEAAQVELVSLLLDQDWVAAQIRRSSRPLRRGGVKRELGAAPSFGSNADGDRGESTANAAFHRKQHAASYRKSSSSTTATAAAYLFQRRSLEELYRQQFLSSLSRTSSFFYSHSYDLTNTIQRNMLADGAEARAEEEREEVEEEAETKKGREGQGMVSPATPRRGSRAQPNSPSNIDALSGNAGPEGTLLRPDHLHQPRMQYVWNEYLLEPWQLPEQPVSEETDDNDDDERSGRGSSSSSSKTNNNNNNSNHNNEESSAKEGTPGLHEREQTRPPPLSSSLPVPHYPPSFARWRIFLIHGYITQRTVAVRRPSFHTLLLTLIARVSKASAGVRYLRRGINSDGKVANHVEVEQIVSDESAWNDAFTDGALSSFVQLRGSVPLRWYHPPTASRILPKPPIVIGPPDAEWSATCLHFQELLREYGGPILAHDLLKRKEHHAQESTLGDAYRVAAQALSAAVVRAAATDNCEQHQRQTRRRKETASASDASTVSPLRSSDVLQYESTDLRDLGSLAWNAMTAIAERHFDQVHCFVCHRRQRAPHAVPSDSADLLAPSCANGPSSTRDYAVAVQLQCGVVRSNCLDCIDRTNLGQLFHGLHALGEQLAGLGLLHHAADLRESPAVTELLLEMYLAMGDALATQYGGSAQVGAGVLHRGAGWDQLMGVKRLYNNVMGDRDKQEAIKLLLGRTQPHPRRHSRARNTAMQSPGQLLPPFVVNTSLSASLTSATPGAAEAAAAAAATATASPSNSSFVSSSFPSSETALVPFPSFSSSLLSSVMHAASRLWGAATGASSATSTAAAAAAVEALRAAQHAAVEAEAEPDYYEHVTSGPRLPAVGLLATWWVQPLKEFTAWYAVCGVGVMARGEDLLRSPYARETTGNGGDGDGGRRSSSSNMEKRDNEEEEEEASAALAPPPPAPSLPSSSARTLGRLATTSTLPRGASPAAVLDDAFAQRLLAAEGMAQQRWRLFIARWERQICLAPPVERTTSSSGAKCRRGASTAGAAVDANAAFSRSGMPGSVAGRYDSTCGGSTTSSAAAAGSILRPSVSTWGMDDGGVADPAASMLDSEAMWKDGSTLSVSGSGAVAVAVAGGGGGGALEATSSFAPFSFTLASSLFAEPWVVLRTTTHLLPVEADPLAATMQIDAPASREGDGLTEEGGGVSTSLSSLYAWRAKDSSCKQPASSALDFSLRCDQSLCTPDLASQSIAFAMMRQLFSTLPPSAATASSWEQQPWRCPEQPHHHETFPRAVQTSVFAQQARALEELACRETMWIAESGQTSAVAADTAALPTIATTRKPRRRDASLRGREEHLRPAERSAAPRQGSHARTFTLPTAKSGTTSGAEEDRQFTSALLQELYGAPAGWGTEEIILALQQLLYPAPLSPAVQRVLRHSDVQPPLSGAELSGRSLLQAAGEKQGAAREYWQQRLLPTAADGQRSTTPQRHAALQGTAAPAARTVSKAESEAHKVAVSLLCRLSSILQGVSSASQTSSAAERRSRSPSPSATQASPSLTASRGSVYSVERLSVPFYKLDGDRDGGNVVQSGVLHPIAAAPLDESLLVAAAAPLLQGAAGDVSPEVLCQFLSPDRPCLTEPLRRYWLLCHLLQPLFPFCVLSPCLLHAMLRNLFGEAPCTPHRTRHHVRYTFALSPQNRLVQQLAAGALAGVNSSDLLSPPPVPAMTSATNSSSAFFSSAPASTSAATAVTAMSVGATSASSFSPSLHAMHIPATLEVKCCCTALELHRWCAQYRTRSQLAHLKEKFLASSDKLAQDAELREEDAAEAVWRLLWWAVENSLVVPVVRRREQTTLEILADETALFCVVADVPSVAVNVERRGRAEVWRRTPQRQQQERLPRQPCEYGDGFSAIYGVPFASAFPVHRLTRRSALTDMVTLSETMASLGLNAAARVQELFRDYALHGWTRTTLRSSRGGDGVVGSGSSSNSGGNTHTISSASVFLSANIGASGGVTAADSGGDSYSPAPDASIPVTPADVVAHFSQLAEECLQSIQSVMVALQLMSLNALADDHGVHAYISFFVNVYNAAYVVAWLTNVKELVSVAATAAKMTRAASANNSAPQPARADALAGAASLRTIDLLPLPTLCNTNIACFMHVYGVVIGHTFVSLAEMKYEILGGNRAPPYRDVPLWLPSLTQPPPQPVSQADGSDLSTQRSSPPLNAWRWARLVPQHLRVEVAENARLASLRQHPHLQAALNWRELFDVYAPKASVGEVRTGTAQSPTAVAAPLFPPTPAFEAQRQRYRELVDGWCTDVVRHLPFRISLQLIDTYLPPPLFHLCHPTDASGRSDAAGSAKNAHSGNGVSGFDEGGTHNAPLDMHLRLDVDAERVPWYLQPMLNTVPLMQSALQSTKLGVVYGVARDDDGRASGALVPQVSPDANGVLLQPCRMWNSPSYYLVGGDGVNSEEAITHSFQLLQSLSGSYLGVHGYHVEATHSTSRSSGSHASGMAQQHLCTPLHHGEALAQLHATETAFRSALRCTDPQIFAETPPYRLFSSSSARLPNATSCSAALHNAMKPLLYEWCRATVHEVEGISLLAKPGSQLRVLLRVLRLLEESYVSGEAVRQSQLTIQECA